MLMLGCKGLSSLVNIQYLNPSASPPPHQDIGINSLHCLSYVSNNFSSLNMVLYRIKENYLI